MANIAKASSGIGAPVGRGLKPLDGTSESKLTLEQVLIQQEVDKEKARLKAERLLKKQDHAVRITQGLVDKAIALKAKPLFKQPKSKRQLKLEEKKLCIEQKIVNQRNDYLHKLSTELTRKHFLIIVEDLSIQAMTASAAGTVEAPGVNIKQTARKNRSIMNQGWGRFLELLEYKQAWQGGYFIRVPAYHTSQLCPVCQHVDKENRPTQAIFKCVACGHEGHADVVASENIYERGLKIFNTPTSERPVLVKIKRSVKNELVANAAPVTDDDIPF